MKFKKMCEMPKKEIEYILKEVCGLEYNELDSIEYDKDNNKINIVVLETWVTKDDDGSLINIEDTEEIIMWDNTIEFEHGQIIEEKYDYKQYILAKGYYYLLKDNKYLE